MMKPLNDRVLLKVEREETTTKSGIILTTEDEGAKTDFAEVLAIGPDVDNIKVGDEVIFDKYAGLPVDKDDDSIIMLEENDIFAIVEEWIDEEI